MDKETPNLIEHGLRGNAINNLVAGWTFRIDEVSSNVYRIQGTNKKGKVISEYGTDPEKVLSLCIRRAQRVDSIQQFFQKILGLFKVK